MKVLTRIAVLFSIFMAIVLIAFLILKGRFSYDERDLIYYNDVKHKAEEEYLSGTDEEEIENRYNCHIVLSTEINDEELSKLYKNNAFALDFEPNGNYIGKIAWTDESNRFDAMSAAFLKLSVIFWGLVLIGGYALIVIMYLFLIKPIRELEKFSVKISKGNLDEPLPIRKNNIFGAFTEAFDLMREQIKEANEREIKSEVARKELVTELSHDVKTPVSVIKAACEVMQTKYDGKIKEIEKSGEDDTTGQKEKEEIAYNLDKINTISAKADTIENLMSNLMHVNLEDMEILEVHPIETNSNVIPEFFSNIRNYGNIILENEIPECLVYMDKLRFEQAIDNVVGNSYKYAGTDIKVSFTTTEAMSESGKNIEFVKIAIKDSGPGAKEEDIPLIAEKYYRGKNASDKSGYGLGLYLVKCYMDKMGGGMEYYNDNGFTVELLLRKV